MVYSDQNSSWRDNDGKNGTIFYNAFLGESATRAKNRQTVWRRWSLERLPAATLPATGNGPAARVDCRSKQHEQWAPTAAAAASRAAGAAAGRWFDGRRSRSPVNRAVIGR